MDRRPVIFDFQSVPEFIRAMLQWRRHTDQSFSIRREINRHRQCSPALVSQVVKGTRRLTRDRIDAFSHLLRLDRKESAYLDRWVANERRGANQDQGLDPDLSTPPRPRQARNHLLTDWLNVYVKDAARLRGFLADPYVVHRLLGGIASLSHIRKSLNFLFKEGFLRKTLDGRIVEDEVLSATTDGIPNSKIRSFHKHALDIAKRGVDLYPLNIRRASCVVLPLDDDSLQELRTMLSNFHERVTEFAEQHPGDNERLYQVVINLCPVGGNIEQTH